jgi:DNA-binding CsgD family transcriptional regulator
VVGDAWGQWLSEAPVIDDRLLDTRALAIPAEVISCLRKAAYRELASASEEVLVIAQTSSHLVHPEEYEDAFARLDGTRALLNDLGWVDIGEPRSGVRINVATLGASLLTVLDRAYTCARRTELSRLSDLLGNLQSTLKDRLEAHADNPVGTMIQRQLALPRPRVPLSELTRRESEVLAHLSRSRSYGEIAVSLSIDVETVRTHARRVRRKLGVRTSRELAGVYIAESEDT